MSPTEFAVRMIAADKRFSQALQRDDIRERRAARSDKTVLLQLYFAASRQRPEFAAERAASAVSV